MPARASRMLALPEAVPDGCLFKELAISGEKGSATR